MKGFAGTRRRDLAHGRRPEVPRSRQTSPATWRHRRLRSSERKDARLLSCVGLHLERRVVLPRDVQTTWQMHDAAGAVRATRLAGGFVLRRVPRLGHTPAFVVDRQIQDVALRRRDHPPSPVVSHERDPIAGEIDRSGRSWRRRLAVLSERRCRCQTQQRARVGRVLLCRPASRAGSTEQDPPYAARVAHACYPRRRAGGRGGVRPPPRLL